MRIGPVRRTSSRPIGVESVGSEDSKGRLKKVSCIEETDRRGIRHLYDRCPEARLRIDEANGLGESFSPVLVEEPLGQSGLHVTSKVNGFEPPSGGPDWAYGRSIKTILSDKLPPRSCIVVHPGDQRFYCRNVFPSDGDAAMYLDLTMSELRDRFALHNEMELFVIDQRSGRYHRITCFVPLLGGSHPGLSWHKRIRIPDDLWRLRQPLHPSMNSYYSTRGGGYVGSSTTASTAISTRVESSIKSQATTKAVSWAASVNEPETITSMHNPLDDEEEARSGGEDEQRTKEAEDFLGRFPQETSVRVDDNDIIKVGAHELFKRKCAVITSKTLSSLPEDRIAKGKQSEQEFKHVSCENVTDPSFAAAISVEHGATQMLLPRVHERPQSTRVLLKLPSSVVFPVLPGDVLVVRNSTRDIMRLALNVPKLSRTVPSSSTLTADGVSGEKLNVGHSMKDLGLEFCHHGGSSNSSSSAGITWGVFSPVMKDSYIPEKNKLNEPKSYMFSKRFFSSPITAVNIGRAEGEITVLDQYLSRRHAQVKRISDTKMFLIEPADAKKVIYLLCGKSDSHSRPPVALRVGDIIACGKSEFTIVFQQRGSRDLASFAGKSPLDELLGRLEAGRSSELSVRRSLALPPLGVKPEDPKPAEADVAGPGKGDATADVPVFNDQGALLEHFENQAGLEASGPMMVLLTTKGPRAKQYFLCNSVETVLGSSPWANVSIPNDKRMAPYHSRVYFDKVMHRWMLEDLQSWHGTFLKVRESTLLSTGDVFLMGTTLVRVLGTHATPSANRCPTQ